MFKKIFVAVVSTYFLVSSLCAHNCPVLGIGAPCMDILMNVDDAFLLSLGKKGGSQQIEKVDVDKIIQQTKIQKSYIATGGSCSNTIKGLCKLGNPCAFFGKVGKDEMGERFLQTVESIGIVPLCLCSASPTQVCICLISEDGDRTMRCYPGAANELTPEDLKAELFEGVSLVHFEGYMLYSNNPDFVPTAMRMAKEAGAIVSFDVSSYDLIRLQKEKILGLLKKYVDVVFANAEEVYELVGKAPLEGCVALTEFCPKAVVMMGDKGCYVGADGFLCHAPAVTIKAVDTTGAGDLFASGFLHGILNGYSLKDCAHFGNKVGAAVCEVYGAEIPEEKWQQLREEFKNYP